MCVCTVAPLVIDLEIMNMQQYVPGGREDYRGMPVTLHLGGRDKGPGVHGQPWLALGDFVIKTLMKRSIYPLCFSDK